MKIAIEHLKRDPLKNVSILGFIENNHIYGCEIVGESVIIRGKSDRDWVYLSCSNEKELEQIKELFTEKDTCFGSIDDWMIPLLTKGKNVLWNLELKQFYLPETIELPQANHEISDLCEKDATTIYENSHYKEFLFVDYIKQQIKNGPGKGIFENGELVAWGLTQDDGALGFLHVMDHARRKGYGLSIALNLIAEVRKANKIPFALIEPTNKNSLALVNKLGFVKQRNCQWFEIQE